MISRSWNSKAAKQPHQGLAAFQPCSTGGGASQMQSHATSRQLQVRPVAASRRAEAVQQGA